ncbi:hypothetical protein AVEN_178544-1 [Araneus ventricosus]|uniref:Transposase Tc1-like domain-containing protein n=1 Tax=Araneus ventricosus TaxID=182803 RepID=A0A4Y2HHS4_ARAVE|nr:hypothetical protein AVEN_178544-1 [Araneus ventricosus]
MDLIEAEAVRRLYASRSVVKKTRGSDSIKKISVEKTCSKPIPAEDRFLALAAQRRRTTTLPQLVSNKFTATGTYISLLTQRRLLRSEASSQSRIVCKNYLQVSLLMTTEKFPLGKRARCLDQTATNLCTLHRENKSKYTINLTLLKDKIVEEVKS